MDQTDTRQGRSAEEVQPRFDGAEKQQRKPGESDVAKAVKTPETLDI